MFGLEYLFRLDGHISLSNLISQTKEWGRSCMQKRKKQESLVLESHDFLLLHGDLYA